MYRTYRNALRRNAGFSLLEIVIALAVIAMIVGVVAIRSGGVINKGKATRVVQLIDTLKKAAAQYHADTNRFAIERMNGNLANRDLSGTQTVAGWQGPYLESPLTAGMHPSSGTMHLFDTSVVNGNTGFDIDGNGVLDVTDSCNTLWLNNVTQVDAQAIDTVFDKGIAGNWYDSGRVKWNSTTSQCWVLVYW
jgi:prepilin-type N-terminal cleavage/methylation domain-containing protein